ncbi:GntR family transcriptional regulator [Acinetobacter sp. ANC 4558]|uniref:GntR family transcriptional regulator n=1 Tax=Acinetobacter sp. ANC 4558 TaxID=1977876 RepID=UPI000A33BB39|nr:GntR family transcriptional regulator [Acinetobacter sp. ANC 4558]OTG87086.1 GntR family transcriptional regulator [Acinetobacter sp. ANC 4558]
MNSQDQLLIQPETLRGQVENKLRECILTGYFHPNQKLVERELCEMLGVSRTSIREALRKLEAEKLIIIIPHKGPIVTLISIQEAKDIYALRKVMEGYAFKLFSQNSTLEQIELLANAVNDLEKDLESKEKISIIHSKNKIYEILFQHCGNTLIQDVINSINSRVNILRKTSLLDEQRLQESIFEIKEILDAIRARNHDLTEKLSNKHVENAEKTALKILEKIHQEYATK